MRLIASVHQLSHHWGEERDSCQHLNPNKGNIVTANSLVLIMHFSHNYYVNDTICNL